MNKQPVVWLIAGTSDGRKLIKALQGQNIQLFVSVATDYGAELVEKQKYNFVSRNKTLNN